jgi:hypothetical protein
MVSRPHTHTHTHFWCPTVHLIPWNLSCTKISWIPIADPHRGNLLRTPDGKLAFIDFGMMADVTEEERYGLIGLAIGLQNKDISLVTENLLKVQ